ncbi:hypothetical protein [Streptomyces sp. NPDC056600]|uniref:hypothetical protein n=1 Tax=Streptomyces sp. NPDC056600 TaxID=3345874 RepID=UPI0036C81A54
MPGVSRRTRRRIPRLVGASCLAASLTLPAGVTTAVAAPWDVGRTAVGEAEPTPPPPPTDPQTPEQQTPDPPQDTQDPGTRPPETDTPETPDTEPGTDVPESPDDLTAEDRDKTDQALDRIDDLDVPAEVKAELKQAVAKIAGALDDPNTSPGDAKIYRQILTDINAALVPVADPATPPEKRRALTDGLRSLDGVLTTATNEQAPAAESTASRQLAGNVARCTALLAAGNAASGRQREADTSMRHYRTVVAGTTDQPRIEASQDRTAVAREVNTQARALATSQNPQATDGDREEADKELERSDRVTENSGYRQVIRQVKSYDASDMCVSAIEERTRQAGWSIGSLWGLSDDACKEPRSAGVDDTSSDWNKLFVCVDDKNFSSCPAYIPKD